MSILEIVIYSILGGLIVMLMTFSIIDQVREKKGKKRLFFKKRNNDIDD